MTPEVQAASEALAQELAPPRNLSLFRIETELEELMQLREDPELMPEERAATEAAIAEYVNREVAKVDGIRAYLRHCEVMRDAANEEAKRQRELSTAWDARREKLMDLCYQVMQAAGKKKLEGKTGTLQIKGNGGRQPVTITEPSLIPDEYCEYVGKVAGSLWRQIIDKLPWIESTGEAEMVRTPRKSQIGDALKNGAVPGAHLEERGSHLECK